MRLRSFLALVGFVGVSLAAGFLGSMAVVGSVNGWYATLIAPAWTPPNAVFGPVWTILYVLMGSAAYLVSRSPRIGKVFAIWLFLAHLLLNAFWSIAFFGMHEILLSLVVIVLLLSIVIVLAALFYRYSRTAGYLMIPYVLWVAYATTLNIGFLVLN
ncbi:MAG: tryptophan-rich sensory protein [Parcubacteria bacterium C7867-004]|nr:MAG: tryptophan-rich sensory protein [Parcubacteria bacterium C7867-004]